LVEQLWRGREGVRERRKVESGVWLLAEKFLALPLFDFR